MRKLTEIEELSLVSDPKTPFTIIKNDNEPKFESVQRLVRGFSDSDLELLDYEAIETLPIQKASSKENPFPSISHQLDLQKQKLADYLNELDSEE